MIKNATVSVLHDHHPPAASITCPSQRRELTTATTTNIRTTHAKQPSGNLDTCRIPPPNSRGTIPSLVASSPGRIPPRTDRNIPETHTVVSQPMHPMIAGNDGTESLARHQPKAFTIIHRQASRSDSRQRTNSLDHITKTSKGERKTKAHNRHYTSRERRKDTAHYVPRVPNPRQTYK